MDQTLLTGFYNLSCLLACVGVPVAVEVIHQPQLMFITKGKEQIPLEKAYALLEQQMQYKYPAAHEQVLRELAHTNR